MSVFGLPDGECRSKTSRYGELTAYKLIHSSQSSKTHKSTCTSHQPLILHLFSRPQSQDISPSFSLASRFRALDMPRVCLRVVPAP